MMKIRLFSDIHNEFAPVDYKIPELDTDHETTLVLAGDIDVGGIKDGTLSELADRFKYVVMVAGNHEFYGHDIVTTTDAIFQHADMYPNVFFLENDSVKLGGIMFYGGTAWTQVPDDKELIVESSMNDFLRIKNLDMDTGKVESLTVKDTNKINEEFIYWLSPLTNSADDTPVVVVSHHSPSMQGCNEQFKGNRINCAYHNDYDEYLEQNPNIKLWLHGHIHNSVDYTIGETRVVANPYGYYNYETNSDFDATLVLEV